MSIILLGPPTPPGQASDQIIPLRSRDVVRNVWLKASRDSMRGRRCNIGDSMLSVWTDIMILSVQEISQVNSPLERETLSLSGHVQAWYIVSIINLSSSIRNSSLLLLGYYSSTKWQALGSPDKRLVRRELSRDR